MRVAGRGYRDGVRSLDVLVESLSGGSRPEIQEEGRVMELNNFLFKYSRRSWREANWVRLSATSYILRLISRTGKRVRQCPL